VNLVTNIGVGEDSTHSMSAQMSVKKEQMVFPLKHPVSVERHKNADIYTLRYYL
jgi:hypothetical protein